MLELGSRARPLIELIESFSEQIGPRRLDSTGATALLVGIASLCWFPLAYADALTQVVGTDSRSPEAINSQTQRVVEFVLAQVGEQPAAESDRGLRARALTLPR